MGAVVEAWHLGNVGIELLHAMYKLTYIATLGLLKYIGDIVLFLLSCVDGKRSEKVNMMQLLNNSQDIPLGPFRETPCSLQMDCFPSAH